MDETENPRRDEPERPDDERGAHDRTGYLDAAAARR
jgi:hypothetical protein